MDWATSKIAMRWYDAPVLFDGEHSIDSILFYFISILQLIEIDKFNFITPYHDKNNCIIALLTYVSST